MSDTQWAVLEPLVREQMARVMRGPGRPPEHDLRAMLDAIAYVTRNGIEWRALPVDFPPHRAVYAFFQRWSERGLPEQLVHRLRERLRSVQDRLIQPTVAILDSQSVKAAEWAGAATRGYDGGKKVNGRKRHLAVDVNGWLLAAVVTTANTSDRHGARLLLIALLNICTHLQIAYADSGYNGWPLRQYFWNTANIVLTTIARGAKHTFKVMPHRWVVERTFAWLTRYRRLARDYERRPEHHQALIWWATAHQMTRTAARRNTPTPRWPPRPAVTPT